MDSIALRYLTLSTYVRQQDSAPVHLAFNAVQLLQCTTQHPFSWAVAQ